MKSQILKSLRNLADRAQRRKIFRAVKPVRCIALR
jgi:hypothetical protein